MESTHHRRHTRPYTDTSCILFCGHTWRTWGPKLVPDATIMLMRLFYRTWSLTIPSRQHYCLDGDSLLIIQSFRTSSPGATIHLRGQQVKTKMFGVVTPPILKAATKQDKHLQTPLLISQRVFDVAERVDGNIFGTEMKPGRCRGRFSDLSGQLQNPEHDNENIHLSNVVA